MRCLKQAWINEREDGTVLAISCRPVGKYRLHQEAGEMLPSSQRCCCARDAIAGPEGVICASGKELRKAAGRAQIAVSSSWRVSCCTSSLPTASGSFVCAFMEVWVHKVPGLGQLYGCGDPAPQKCKEGRRKRKAIWNCGILNCFQEAFFSSSLQCCLTVACLEYLVLHLPNSWLTHVWENKLNQLKSPVFRLTSNAQSTPGKPLEIMFVKQCSLDSKIKCFSN